MVAKLYSQIKKDGRAGRDADGDGLLDERGAGITREVKSHVKNTVRNDFSQLFSEHARETGSVSQNKLRRDMRAAVNGMGGY